MNSFKNRNPEKDKKKLKNASHLINGQKKVITTLFNILSSGIGYIPGAGPLKSLGEGIIGRDFLTKRKIKVGERSLKTGAGLSGLVGYFYLLKPYIDSSDIDLNNIGHYAVLSGTNSILYTLSLLAAGGEQAKKIKDTQHQIIQILQTPHKIIQTKKRKVSNTIKTEKESDDK